MTTQTQQRNIDMGNRIRVARNQACMTQEVLAEKAGLSVQHISDLERGINGLSISTLIKLSELLHISSDQILFGTPKSSPLEAYLRRLSRLPDYEQRLIIQQLTLIEEALSYQRET